MTHTHTHKKKKKKDFKVFLRESESYLVVARALSRIILISYKYILSYFFAYYSSVFKEVNRFVIKSITSLKVFFR